MTVCANSTRLVSCNNKSRSSSSSSSSTMRRLVGAASSSVDPLFTKLHHKTRAARKRSDNWRKRTLSATASRWRRLPLVDAVAHDPPPRRHTHGDGFHSASLLVLFVLLLPGCLTMGANPNTRAVITNSCSTCLTVGTPLFIFPLRLLMGSSVPPGCFQITAGKQQAAVTNPPGDL